MPLTALSDNCTCYVYFENKYKVENDRLKREFRHEICVTVNFPVLGSSLTGFILEITPVSYTSSYYRAAKKWETYKVRGFLLPLNESD